jgi:hypothetical protein
MYLPRGHSPYGRLALDCGAGNGLGKPSSSAWATAKENERAYLGGLFTRHQPSPVTTVPGETERPYPRRIVALSFDNLPYPEVVLNSRDCRPRQVPRPGQDLFRYAAFRGSELKEGEGDRGNGLV